MKIDLSKKIMGVDGIKALSNQDTKCDLTLEDVCINAILTPEKEDKEKQKYEAYELFIKLRDCKTKEIELTTEKVVYLKKKIGLIILLITGYPLYILNNKKLIIY